MTDAPSPPAPGGPVPPPPLPPPPPALPGAPAAGKGPGLLAEIRRGGRFFSLKFKLMGARSRAQSAGQQEASLQLDLGRAGWERCPGLSFPPTTEALSGLDRQIAEARQKAGAAQKEIERLEALRTQQEKTRAEELGARDKDIQGVQSTVDSLHARRSEFDRGRSEAQAGGDALEREIQALKAPPPPPPPPPPPDAVAIPPAPPPPAPSPEEIARKIADAEARRNEARGRFTSLSDQLTAVDRDLVPHQAKLKELTAAREAVATRHDVELSRLAGEINTRRGEVSAAQAQIAAHEAAQTPLFADLGKRLQTDRAQAEALKEEYARLDAARGQSGQAEAEVRALDSEASAIPPRARLLFGGAVAVPVVLLLGAVLLLASLLGGSKPTTPEKAFRAAQEALGDNNWERFYDLLSTQSVKELEAGFAFIRAMPSASMSEAQKKEFRDKMGCEPSELGKMTTKEIFVKAARANEKGDPSAFGPAGMTSKFGKAKYKGMKMEGEGRATITFEVDGKDETMKVVKEGEIWKLIMKD